MLANYSSIAVFLLVALGFVMIAMAASWFVRPKAANAVKLDTYECGLETEGPTWIQFKISYFMYALIFLVFDVETLFLYPWAVKFQALGLFAFIEMVIFIAILAIGLWYAWKEGALEWQ